MNTEAYEKLIEKVKELIFEDGRPLYKLAPQIGVNDCTLKRFISGGGVNIFTVIQIADYFNIKLFP